MQLIGYNSLSLSLSFPVKYSEIKKIILSNIQSVWTQKLHILEKFKACIHLPSLKNEEETFVRSRWTRISSLARLRETGKSFLFAGP